MKYKNLIIIITVITLGIGIGFGIYFTSNKSKKANSKEDDITETNKGNKVENELSKEEALQILKDKYNTEIYLIEFDFDEYDLYFFNIKNIEKNLIEMIVSVNRYTKEVRENKVIGVGGNTNQIGVSGGKIN